MQEQLKSSNWRLWLGGLVVLVLIVMAFCWWLWAPAPAKPEVYAPAVKQADGSVVLEKKPDAQAKPKQVIPPGAKVSRIASVTVQPRSTQSVPAALKLMTFGHYSASADRLLPAASSTPCPPVTVDLSLVILPDKTKRIIASSPDGAVVGGVDIPVEDVEPAPAPKLWAAGAVLDPLRRTYGAFIDRDVGFLRLGIQVNQRNEGELPTQGWVKAGIRF